jgi:hypothetical protein
MKCVPDLVFEKGQEKVKRQTPLQCGVQIWGSQPVILLEFTCETFKIKAQASDASRPDAVAKRSNQVAIQIAPYLRRRPKTGRDFYHNCFQSLGRAGPVLQFPFDMPERPRPHSPGEFMNARINGPMVIVARANPERRNPVWVRGETLCILPQPNNPFRAPTRLAAGASLPEVSNALH